MTFNPGVSWFIDFDKLDPKTQSKCIFYNQKGARCEWKCTARDNSAAIALHNEINAIINGSSNEAITIDMLERYISYNCCRSGRARHQDRIEDIGLLRPLARRWLGEIQTRIDSRSCNTPPDRRLHNECQTVPRPSPSPDVVHATITNNSSILETDTTSSILDAVTISDQTIVRDPTDETSSPSTAVQNQHCYDLRSRGSDHSETLVSDDRGSATDPILSEFRPHIVSPLEDDSVSCKIREPLNNRDFETGALYIFNRESSPGYVKIGWTARSIPHRLQAWSNCGYVPNLLFSLYKVSHAQRVETLTHYELIKEWRRERMCKAPWCGKSHQEWFEVSVHRAEQILGDWANFMNIARPYKAGVLRKEWSTYVEAMDEKGETVTVKSLLEHYEQLSNPASVQAITAEPQVNLTPVPIVKQEAADSEATLSIEDLSLFKDLTAHITEIAEQYSAQEETLLSVKKDEPLLKSEEVLWLNNEETSSIKAKDAPSIESQEPPDQTSIDTSPDAHTQTYFGDNVTLETKSIPKTRPISGSKLPFRTKFRLFIERYPKPKRPLKATITARLSSVTTNKREQVQVK